MVLFFFLCAFCKREVRLFGLIRCQVRVKKVGRYGGLIDFIGEMKKYIGLDCWHGNNDPPFLLCMLCITDLYCI